MLCASIIRCSEVASRKSVAVPHPGWSPSYAPFLTAYGFKMATARSRTLRFGISTSKTLLIPQEIQNKNCCFYPLAPYLERGYTVDDITTAIRTGWKMSGDKETPTISFHKETKLLIAVGEPDKLEVIDNVLRHCNRRRKIRPTSSQNRLKQIMKNTPPPSVPVAPPSSVKKPPTGTAGKSSGRTITVETADDRKICIST